MNLNDIVFAHFQEKNKREFGRYRATDIYKIKKGYLTPENYFEDKHID